MECTCLTPFNVLETSGHVEKFTDLMVCFSLIEVTGDASNTRNEQHCNLYQRNYRVLPAITFVQRSLFHSAISLVNPG